MKKLLWENISIKTAILGLLPTLISIVSGVSLSNQSIVGWIVTVVLVVVYVGYLIINHKYEREQDRHEEWHDAITDLCSQSGPLIRKLADSLHQKVTDRVGHVEITDWSMVKERCDDVCKCTYEFIRKIATRVEMYPVLWTSFKGCS